MGKLKQTNNTTIDKFIKYIKKIFNKEVRFRLLVISVVLICCLLFLYITGIIWVGEISHRIYPIQGVDVSHYQGNIDWDVLSKENISFAYIKATEGSGTKDERFEYNWNEALKTDLRIGAYHFFSFDSEGETQADNFIETVPVTDDALPPVIDFEFYGDKKSNKPDYDKTIKELEVVIKRLKEHYGKTPVIYCTYSTYIDYIDGNFNDCPLWIRNTHYKPGIFDNIEWTFWQYTGEGRKKGYDGKDTIYDNEENIDINIFNGNEKEFREF